MAVILRFPFYRWERLMHDRGIEETEIEKDPIFIVGHWRSGTTYLHNLLSQDPQFAWISFLQTAMPWDFLGKLKIAPPIIEKILPETRGMDNVRLSLDSPQEEEMALGNMGLLCYYYCYYFPRHFREIYRRSILLEGVGKEELEEFAYTYNYLLKKLAYSEENRGKRLLLKNPAATARIPWLRSVFPKAKFIHIVRNPFEVFCSTVRHFGRTMPAFAWQNWKDLDFEEITLENYELIMRRFLRDRNSLSTDCFFELKYESLERNPMDAVEEIYDHFRLEKKMGGLSQISAYVESERAYRKNVYTIGKPQIEAIRERWAFSLQEWKYDLPPGITVIENAE